MPKRILPLFSSAWLCAVVIASAQEPPKYLKTLVGAKAEEEARLEDIDMEDGKLEETIDCIGESFDSEDAGVLDDCLVPRRVYLSLKGSGEKAGYYGRSQIKFMFDKVFRERRTRSFSYDSRDIEFSGDGSAYFRAAWTYVVLDEDEIVTEHLRFKMERDKGDWRVSEIRTASR